MAVLLLSSNLSDKTAIVMQTQEIPEVTIRSFRPGDENIFLELLKNSFGSLEYLPRLKGEITGPYLDHEGSFVAEKNGLAIGCIGLRNLPRKKWHEIRYLAVKNGEPRIPLAALSQNREIMQNQTMQNP